MGDDEVEKLLRHGSGWLPAHPEKEEITKRYLKYSRDLAREALAPTTFQTDLMLRVLGAGR